MATITLELSDEALALLAERARRRGRTTEEYGTLVMQQSLLFGDRDELDELFYLQHVFKAMQDFLQFSLDHVDIQADDPEGFIACIRSLQSEWNRIQRITDTALSLGFETIQTSQVWSQGMPYSGEEFELRPLLQKVMDTCERSAYKRPTHSLQYEVAENVPQHLDCDVDKVEQILYNLIGNALKFSPDGGTILLRVSRHNADKICFSIQDQGIGMSPESLQKFGTKFFRASDNKPHGVGIGAFLVKLFVQLHSGEFWVDSEGIGKGTTASFTLPSNPATIRDPEFTQAVAELRRWRIKLSALLAEVEALPRTRYYFDATARAAFAQLVHAELEQMQAFLAQLEKDHAKADG